MLTKSDWYKQSMINSYNLSNLYNYILNLEISLKKEKLLLKTK